MGYNNLGHFIKKLEEAGELKRISHPVSPALEISEITDRIVKNNGPALLFENTGTDFPVLINSMGSEKRIAMALGVENLDQIGSDIEAVFHAITIPRQGFMDKNENAPGAG
jgi:4-hydroxy-3-polyprenylbenzoate decarboxylase